MHRLKNFGYLPATISVVAVLDCLEVAQIANGKSQQWITALARQRPKVSQFWFVSSDWPLLSPSTHKRCKTNCLSRSCITAMSRVTICYILQDGDAGRSADQASMGQSYRNTARVSSFRPRNITQEKSCMNSSCAVDPQREKLLLESNHESESESELRVAFGFPWACLGCRGLKNAKVPILPHP